MTKRVVAAVLVAVALASGGCAASYPAPSQLVSASPSSAARTPADGVTLASLGFTNGPSYLLVPRGVVIKERVDQPNVVTLVLTWPDGPTVARYLTGNVEAMGFRLVASSSDSVVFADDHWDGAFTSVDGLAGLTLRRIG